MKKAILLFFCATLFVSLLLASCSVFGPPEPTPTPTITPSPTPGPYISAAAYRDLIDAFNITICNAYKCNWTSPSGYTTVDAIGSDAEFRSAEIYSHLVDEGGELTVNYAYDFIYAVAQDRSAAVWGWFTDQTDAAPQVVLFGLPYSESIIYDHVEYTFSATMTTIKLTAVYVE